MKKYGDRMMFFGLLAKDISPRKVSKDHQQTVKNDHTNLQMFYANYEMFYQTKYDAVNGFTFPYYWANHKLFNFSSHTSIYSSKYKIISKVRKYFRPLRKRWTWKK